MSVRTKLGDSLVSALTCVCGGMQSGTKATRDYVENLARIKEKGTLLYHFAPLSPPTLTLTLTKSPSSRCNKTKSNHLLLLSSYHSDY